MGRKKVHIKYIENSTKRFVSFIKRLQGLWKKIHDLSKLTGSEIFAFVNYGHGQHLRMFSVTGDFENDILFMSNQVNMARANPDESSFEVTTVNDYEEDYCRDDKGNLWLQYVETNKTCYVKDPWMRSRGIKMNTRLAKIQNKARQAGLLAKDNGGNLIPPVEEEDQLRKNGSKNKKRRNRDPAIIEDDDEIRAAVGEDAPRKAQKSLIPETSHPEPVVQTSYSAPVVQNISVSSDGTVNLSQTEMTITHTNVRMRAANLTRIGSQFGTESGASAFRFSMRGTNPPPPTRPPPPPPSVVIEQIPMNSPPPLSEQIPLNSPPPFESSSNLSVYRNLIPGVPGDEIMAFLNAPRPPSLQDKRQMERHMRSEMIAQAQEEEEFYDMFEMFNSNMYGSFIQ